MRIAFFVRHRFHNAILRPIFDELQARHDCLLTHRFDLTVGHRPHVVVQSEGAVPMERLRRMLPSTLMVHTRHGLAAKTVTYRGVMQSDYTCVTSEWVRDQYLLHNAQPRRAFWLTGYSQLDPLFRGEAIALPFAIPENHQRVLIAPTYDRGLSGVPLLNETALRQLLSPGRTVIVKPHPHTEKTFPEWFFMCRELASREENFHFASDAHEDLMAYLRCADVLISDASSAALEFLALDRPIVLLNNPARWNDRHYDPKGLEWRWRDMGEELDDVELLPGAVDSALQNPDARRETRQHYRRLLFGDLTDGQTARRIAQKIEELEPLVESAMPAKRVLSKAAPPAGRWF